MLPKFLYFDLGKVLVDFSVDQMLRQMAAVAGITPERVREAIFGGGLMRQHECGRLSSRDFYEAFCAAAGSRPDFARLSAAAAEIFTLNVPMLPLVAQLRQAGYPMGILSNTCETHWPYCHRRYRIVAEGFAVYALSYRIGAMKPEAAIFHAAAGLCGHRPEDIFFVDDLPATSPAPAPPASTPCSSPPPRRFPPSCAARNSVQLLIPMTSSDDNLSAVLARHEIELPAAQAALAGAVLRTALGLEHEDQSHAAHRLREVRRPRPG